MTETGVDYAYPDQDVTTVRTDGGQVVWYVPETPYVVLVDTGSGVSGCIVYGPYSGTRGSERAGTLGPWSVQTMSQGFRHQCPIQETRSKSSMRVRERRPGPS